MRLLGMSGPGAQRFDGHFATEPGVFGEIHIAHAAAAEQSENFEMADLLANQSAGRKLESRMAERQLRIKKVAGLFIGFEERAHLCNEVGGRMGDVYLAED